MGLWDQIRKGIQWGENLLDQGGDIVDVIRGPGGDVTLAVDPEAGPSIDTRVNVTPPTNAAGDGILRSTVDIGGKAVPVILLAVGAFILFSMKR